jgi:hypothetical protein
VSEEETLIIFEIVFESLNFCVHRKTKLYLIISAAAFRCEEKKNQFSIFSAKDTRGEFCNFIVIKWVVNFYH